MQPGGIMKQAVRRDRTEEPADLFMDYRQPEA
jgi:hypothetical protein